MRVNNDNSTAAIQATSPAVVRAQAPAPSPRLTQDSYQSSAAVTKPAPSPHKGILGDFEAVAHKVESFLHVVIFMNTMQALDRTHKQLEKAQEAKTAEAQQAQYDANAQAEAQKKQNYDKEQAAAAAAKQAH